MTVSDSYNTTWPRTCRPSFHGVERVLLDPGHGIPNDTYTASVGATATTLAANQSGSIADVPTYATTSITAVATPAPYGKQSITGTLTYQSGLSQADAPAGVTITAAAKGQSPVSTTTIANGSFSMMLPAVTGTTSWNLSSQADTGHEPVPRRARRQSISATRSGRPRSAGFTATLSKYYVLTVGGCLSSPIITPAPPPDYPTVQIQYELTTAGPWRELGTVSTTQMTGCPGAAFLAQGGAPAASAYYRAYLPRRRHLPVGGRHQRQGRAHRDPLQPVPGVPAYLASRSKKVTISGTLQYRGSKWRGYAHQRVLLIYSMNNKTWYAYQWVRTNSTGAFSLTFADSVGTAYWSANYNGNARTSSPGRPS